MGTEEIYESSKRELNFNAILINRDRSGSGNMENLIVKDLDSRDARNKKMRIKLPGGMMNKCDIDPKCFLTEIERLMREGEGAKFDDKEIGEILSAEKKLIDLKDTKKGTHRMYEYGAVRESFEEIRVWPRKLVHLHYWYKPVNLRDAKSKPVHYNFYFITEYSVPKGWNESFVAADQDVKGKAWISLEELMSQDMGPNIMRIIGTHRPALEALAKQFAGTSSEQLSVFE